MRTRPQRIFQLFCHAGQKFPKEQVNQQIAKGRMKTKITYSINSHAIAVALFCDVAILSPTPASKNHDQ
jgi:hypothetical protein